MFWVNVFLSSMLLFRWKWPKCYQFICSLHALETGMFKITAVLLIQLAHNNAVTYRWYFSRRQSIQRLVNEHSSKVMHSRTCCQGRRSRSGGVTCSIASEYRITRDVMLGDPLQRIQSVRCSLQRAKMLLCCANSETVYMGHSDSHSA